MDRPDISALFTPLQIRSVTLPNRFVLPAMQRGWARDGRPLEKLATYYAGTVRGGVSLVISEACGIDHPACTSNRFASRINEDTYDEWARCVEAVHEAGGQMLIQLWHEGSFREDAEIRSLTASGLSAPGMPNGKTATRAELEELKEAFVRSALLAERAGADGVEIHCAHGYLLDQFLWHGTNLRDDGYGGAEMSDRVRFPAEVVAGVREVLDPGHMISVRFSQFKSLDFGASIAHTPAELGVMLDAFAAAGADAMHASARRFYRPAWEGSDLGLAGWTKSLTHLPVIAVGSVGLSNDVYDSILSDGVTSATGEAGVRELMRRFNNKEFDLVSVGRSVIGDPEWILKVRDGRYEEIRTFTKDDIAMEWDMNFMEQALLDAHAKASVADAEAG
jgi:2,4-dienoyl-CoA reductase-like NADH-dependent reductase (Old Yellow Enzyme family)